MEEEEEKEKKNQQSKERKENRNSSEIPFCLSKQTRDTRIYTATAAVANAPPSCPANTPDLGRVCNSVTARTTSGEQRYVRLDEAPSASLASAK